MRKYFTEFSVIATVSSAYVGREQEFRRTPLPANGHECHLYLVASRPRMSVEPRSVRITDDEIAFTLRLQQQDKFVEYDLSERHSLDNPRRLKWVANWPYEEFGVVDTESDERIAGGVVGLLQALVRRWPPDAAKHRVEYIGQAFGQAGERTAWDRLKKHETVQRINGEMPRDRQVWLHLAAITDLNMSSDMDPRYPPTSSNADDETHRAAVLRSSLESPEFWNREAVTLSEAGLIRYFQPQFNDRMKYNFPARRQVSLESVRALDLYGLIVELQGEHVGATFGSEIQPYRSLHFGGFVLHREPARHVEMTMVGVDTLINPNL